MSDTKSVKTVGLPIETFPARGNDDTVSESETVSKLSETVTSLPAEAVDDYAEKELAMVFEFGETPTCHRRDDHVEDSDDSSVSTSTQSAEEFTDNQGMTVNDRIFFATEQQLQHESFQVLALYQHNIKVYQFQM